MTTTEIADRIETRADDSAAAPASFTEAEVLHAINEGQQFFCWLTLCLEATAPVAIAAATTFAAIRPRLPDFLVPLRITVSGRRLRPSTLTELDALDLRWQTAAGTPTRYVVKGFNFLALDRQSTTPLASSWTYARSPILLNDGDTPEIPEQYHPALVDYGVYRVKLKEGGQGLARGLARLNAFLDAASEHGDYVRAKSRAARYDTLPFELALFDRSLLRIK